MTTKNQTSPNMGQVIDRVNKFIELAKREEITTQIDDKDIAEISAMLIDIDNFTQQKIGKPFAELKCKEIDLSFLNFYKEYLLRKAGQSTEQVHIRANILALHSIFILVHAYDVADMDIDMFELFLETTKQDGVI